MAWIFGSGTVQKPGIHQNIVDLRRYLGHLAFARFAFCRLQQRHAHVVCHVVFYGLIISMSFTYTWLRMKSGSVWTAVLLHASHNLFIQSIFTPLTQDTGNSAYCIDEFGAVLPVAGIILAVYFWTRRAELANPECCAK